jgi:hypothetical protein
MAYTSPSSTFTRNAGKQARIGHRANVNNTPNLKIAVTPHGVIGKAQETLKKTRQTVISQSKKIQMSRKKRGTWQILGCLRILKA